MVAALLGAAEAALIEAAESSPATVRVDAGRMRLVIEGLDETHIFVTAAPASMAAGPAAILIEQGLERLKAVLGG